jgi:hypothetical protein
MQQVQELLQTLVRDQRILLATNRKLSKVHDWWLDQYANRERQARHRTKKGDQQQGAVSRLRSCTVRNDSRHSLLNSEATVMTANPKVEEAMLNRLSQFVDDAPNWFRMHAVLNPRKSVVLLFSLYNHSTWVPWISTSGNNMKVFRDWKEDGKPSFTFPAFGQVIPKISPPNRWTDSAVVAFCEAWFWKVCTIVFRFVDGLIDLQDPELGEFKSLMDVTCAFSCYVVHRELEWDPASLYNWDRKDALKAYRKVAPRLKTLREAFETGICTSLESLVQNPK